MTAPTVHLCGDGPDDRACGLEVGGPIPEGTDFSYDECHHPWTRAFADRVVASWVDEADRPTLITAIALCQTARDNDHARLAHLIAEGSDPAVQDAYRRGAERAQACVDLLARLAAAIPRTP